MTSILCFGIAGRDIEKSAQNRQTRRNEGGKKKKKKEKEKRTREREKSAHLDTLGLLLELRMKHGVTLFSDFVGFGL